MGGPENLPSIDRKFSWWTSTEGRVVLTLWLLFLGVIGMALFMPRPVPGRNRERLERLREGAVEIIADGVEEGVRRATKEALR